jgi:ABC-2 type transport system ATP-binding protein
MSEAGITMMIVSHSAGQVRELCSRGIVIRKGKVIFDGHIDDALDVLNGK